MIIKKFIGKTEEEATEMAKKELGNGLVIMNVRSVKRKGLFAPFLPKQVEVTAALEEENIPQPVKETASRQTAEVRTRKSQDSTLSQPNAGTANIEKKLDSLQLLLENQLQQTKQLEKMTEKEPLSRQDGKKEPEEDTPGDSVRERTPEKKEKEENPEQDKFIRLLYNTMLDNEVDEKYVNQILEEADKTKKPNLPFDYILANIYQKMVLKFGRSEGILPAENGPKIVLFIGPTGVGKTTTIAKLASRFSVDQKKKVVLLTADTYRIAAAEQLRTYANILEVPFRVIYTPEEFAAAIQDFKEFDYIFVDTAGHSHQNSEQLQKMKELLESLKDSAQYQTFLVLSATTKYRDLLKIADIYREIAEYQLIFTKLDETDTLGNLLNLKLYTDTPIAYVTCGQNVPDDMENFNPQKTVKQLLGGKAQA